MSLEKHELDQMVGGQEKSGKKMQLVRNMGLWTGVSIIIGNVIGGGIFVSPVGVFSEVGSPGAALLVWAICGILCITGAFCYAELGLTIPTSGGDYIYVLRCFGPLLAFLRLWIAILVIYPVQQTIMAWVFGQYIISPFSSCDKATNELAAKLLTGCAIAILTWANCRSTKLGTSLNNLFTASKVSALGLLIILGLKRIFIDGSSGSLAEDIVWADTSTDMGKYASACLKGLFSYQGWSYLNFVVEELVEPKKNLPRGIFISILTCTGVYLLVNIAYFAVLSPLELMSSKAVAIDVANQMLPGWLQWLIPICVALSCFGGVNGSIIVSSRIFFIGAREDQLPRIVSMIHPEQLTPIPALLCTGTLSILYLFTGAGMYNLMSYCMFANWVWYAFAVAGLIYWRFTRKDLERPMKINLIIPFFFIGLCLLLLVFSIYSEPLECLAGFGISLIGIPVYFLFIHQAKKHPEAYKFFMDDLTKQGQLLFNVVPEDKED
ncbi:Oidioi.mRNA.OKI2018_I69.chr2.g5390.t1.cds [Oikopleura dioica]|uniref:Oidioi.mRNA.OKI2018_I69.chr2.g5390.t1.cds n=1 Tax=Oikopleura dioica TaxID=34765 RepID=A0ABN7T3J3_OIKDI|nr:Oidioi.mRNA.OKI2018_I69.chr2.g5390.t1.cds [Oikopleura dioica]